MNTLTPTKDRGAQTRTSPALYAEASQQMTDTAMEPFLADSGMNGPFIADTLSAMLTHERCGRHLYRSCAARSNNPMLQGKYREFGEETERHVAILEDLIVTANGNPNYVSPMARAVQGIDTKLVESTFALAGSVDVMTAEMAMLDAVFLAESIDHANWKTFAALTAKLPAGTLRDRFQAAVDEVEAQEDEHLEWAATTKQRMVMMQASSGMMTTIGAKAEELVARVRNWFNDEP